MDEIIRKYHNNNKLLRHHMELYINNNPENISAKFTYSSFLYTIQEYELSQKNFLELLDKCPNNANILFFLSNICINLKLFLKADYYINQCLNFINNLTEIFKKEDIYSKKADILCNLSKEQEAIKYCLLSFKESKDNYNGLISLSSIFYKLNNYTQCIKTLDKILILYPNNVEVYLKKSLILIKQLKINQTLEIINKGLILYNKNLNLLLGKALCFYYQKNFIESKNMYTHISSLIDTNNIQFLEKFNYNRSMLYYSLNDKLAIKYLENTLKYDMNNKDYLIMKFKILMTNLEFKKAWIEFYKVKNKTQINYNVLDSNILNSKHILLLQDEGVGDNILFLNVLDEFLNNNSNMNTNSNITLMIDPRLIPLLNNYNGLTILDYNKFSNKIKEYDIKLYLWELSSYFRNSIDSFKKGPYLKIQNSVLETVKYRLSFLKNKFRIGLSWKTYNKHTNRNLKKASLLKIYENCINLDMLLPILKLKNIDFINLQYGDISKEIENFEEKNNIKIHTIENIDLYNDFESTGALLQNIDLLITISNTTAHLAGSLGIQTYLIKSPLISLWYWNMNKNNKNVCYDSIRVFSSENTYTMEEHYNDIINNIKEHVINKFGIDCLT